MILKDQTLIEVKLPIRTGPLGAWLNRREFDAVRQHTKEEGENLKRMLESEKEGEALRA